MKKPTAIKVILVAFVLVLCAGNHGAVMGQEEKPQPAMGAQSLFAYDKNLPLMPEEEVLEETETRVKYHVKYFSANGLFVTGLLTLPRQAKAPWPAVIFQHGFSGNKQSEPLIGFGTEELVKNGYAVISIDAAQHGERQTALTRDKGEAELLKYPYVMRDVFVQTVIDIRRAVDYLQKRGDIDNDRIYYMGISMGALQGVMAAAMEKRIKGLITVVGGGNLMNCNPLYKAMSSPRDKDLAAIMEPVNYVGSIAPRPALMLNGANDPLFPPPCAKALFDAAGDPKEQIFYDTKHNIPLEQGMETVIRWLKEINGGEAPQP